MIYLPEIVTAQSTLARKGVLDLRQWDFTKHGTVNLSGEWEFYMSEFVSAEEFKNNSKPPQDYIDFPSTWNDVTKSLNPGEGYATYRLIVLIKAPKALDIELPHFYSSYSFWINSKLIAKNGKVGTSAASSQPYWLPQTIGYTAESDTLEMVFHASNFHHAKGGVREPLRISQSNVLIFKHQVAITSNVVLFASLSITAIILIFIFFFVKGESSVLYFSALCLTWGVRSVFSNLYLANHYIQDLPWEFSVKIEYISLYMVMIWAILFVSSLFKNEVNNVFKYFLCACNIIFIVLTIFSDASLYTQFLPVYLSFCGVLLVYIVYVLIRAFVYEREGIWLMVSCLFLGVIIFSYDIIAYEGMATFNPIIINLGYLVMFMLMATSLLYQLGFLKKTSGHSNMLTYEDLYGTTTKDAKR